MWIDTQETFSDGQAVASAVGDVIGTNVYDTGAAADVGIGEEMYLFAKLGTALAGAGSSIQVVLQTSAAEASGYTDAAAGPVVPLASAKANTDIAKIRLPIGLKRYLRVVYRVSGAAASGGTASAFLVKDAQAQQYGASGFKVL